MLTFIKKLFCRHQYHVIEQGICDEMWFGNNSYHFTDYTVSKCSKCGKIIRKEKHIWIAI